MRTSVGKLVLWSLAGPALFLAAVLAFSVAAGVAGVPAERIEEVVSGQGSAVLLVAGLAFAVLALWLPLGEIWRVRQPWAADAVLGAVLGVGVALVYLVWLSPALIWAQGRFGDYVPAGSVGAAISGNLVLFGLANVLLAPAVEETVYRGYLLPRMMARLGSGLGFVVCCLAFGLLHWLGGFWYMVLTGVVAGGLFAGLRLWRGGMVAPFAAHLSLNLVEYLASVAR